MGPLRTIEYLITAPIVVSGFVYLAISSLRRARGEATQHPNLDEALQESAPAGSRRRGSWTEQTTQLPTPHNGLN